MPFRRNNWYNLHSTRRYPLDDKATGTGDDGVRLRDDIITDLHIRYPEDAGEYCFLAGLTITDKLITAVFLAADDLDNPTVITPIASVHAVRPVTESLHIPVKALYEQVGGFVVFGDTTEKFIGRFSTPRQGLVAPRAARPFERLPIPTVRRETNGTGLRGLVTLRGATDVEVLAERIEVSGYGDVNAVIIRLKQTPLGPNVLEKYIGPCGTRPESGNCEKPPIETVNGATPDCDGNIDILFCQVETAPFVSCGSGNPAGVIIDGSIGIEEVCAEPGPDRFRGRDLCLPSLSLSSSSLSSESLSSLSLSSLSLPSSSSAGSYVPSVTLPFHTNFDSGAPYFAEQLGEWDFNAISSPGQGSISYIPMSSSRSSCWLQTVSLSSLSSGTPIESVEEILNCDTGLVNWNEPILSAYRCTAEDRRNVSIWAADAYLSSVDKDVTTDILLEGGPQENGGIILNWHGTPYEKYFLALLDRRENALRIMQYTGTSPIIEIARVQLSVPPVLGHWYRMNVTTQLYSGSTVIIHAEVSGVSNPAWPSASIDVPTNKYYPDDGLFGLGSVRGRCNFSFFEIKERT